MYYRVGFALEMCPSARSGSIRTRPPPSCWCWTWPPPRHAGCTASFRKDKMRRCCKVLGAAVAAGGSFYLHVVLLWSLPLMSAFCKNTAKSILLSSIYEWGKWGWRLFKSLQRSARYITIITGSLTSIICLFKCLSSSISGYTLPRQSESLDCLSGLWGDSAPTVLCPRMLLPSPGQAQGPWPAEHCLQRSDNGRPQSTTRPLRSLTRSRLLLWVLVFMSLIIHEIIRRGNNENLLGCEHP